LSNLLQQVDFGYEMLIVHSIGKLTNWTGVLHVVDVDTEIDANSVSISVRIGVNAEDCNWPDSDSYPFVLAVTRKISGPATTIGYSQGNFGDGCKQPVSGKAAGVLLGGFP
jgi:hypothetical protein